MNFISKLKNGLSKTRTSMISKIDDVIKNFVKIDEQFFEELLEILIISDVGFSTSEIIIDALKDKVKSLRISEPEVIKDLLKDEIMKILTVSSDKQLLCLSNPSPTLDVIMVVGINGTGKTTSIGKIANQLTKDKNQVLIAAGDTFRAAANEQLEIWSKRAKADFVKHKTGADPGAVIYDAIHAAKKRKKNIVICDTAGRLHTKKNLMEELKKINKIILRELGDGQYEKLIVLDATSGNNALVQVKAFHEAIGIDGIILTKLDGTAKGGIIIAICQQLNIPIKYIGVGEKIDDLQQFSAKAFIDALF